MATLTSTWLWCAKLRPPTTMSPVPHLIREFRAQAAEAHGAQRRLVEFLAEAVADDGELDDAVIAADVVAELPDAAARVRHRLAPPPASARGSAMRPATAEAATACGPAR